VLCILYFTAVGALLGTIGALIERLLPAAAPRRWIWCAIIPLSVALPGYYRFHNNWSITAALEHHSRNGAGGPIAPGLFAILDPAWWAGIRDCDPIINTLWVVASALVLIWGVVNAMRVSAIVRSSNGDHDRSADATIIDGVRVLVTEHVGPATVGLWRSHVLIPRWVLALPRTERRCVLRHEDEHRRSRDAHLLLAASLAILLMPWNLAVWWQVRRLRLAVEMDCDNRVVSWLGDPSAYCELLLKVAQASSRGPRLQPAFLGAGTLEKRLTALVAPAPLRSMQRFLLPTAALGLLCVVLWMPHPINGAQAHRHVTTASTTIAARQD
jgi:beta-lactamase regulating signal transducer with metallopeptidase domain